MKIIQTQAEIGPDHLLHLKVPLDIPEGPVEVLVVLEVRQTERTQEERRAAAQAGAGILKHIPGSVDEFVKERREEDRRRDKALGL